MTSSTAPGSPTTDYLFDFVYLDRPRVSSYVAQLVDEGILTATKQVLQSTDGIDSQMRVGLGIGGVQNTDKASTSNSLERSFDASWSSLVGAIHKLDEMDYISSSIAETQLGGLTRVAGKLEIFDIRMLRAMWPFIAKQISKSATGNMQAKQLAKKEAEEMADLLAKLPHVIQMSIYGSIYGGAWATLDPQYMTLNTDDFAFKHGSSIAGEWHVIGVLDAKPDQDEPEANFPLMDNQLRNGMILMTNALREMFGRPASFYGLTPIAIFRPIRRNGQH